MDPFTIAALTYIATKISDKFIDKTLEVGFDFSAEKILPKKTFNERLRIVIQKTSDEFEKDQPKVSSKMFSFANSELLFLHLIESRIYNNKDNPLTVSKFTVNQNIVLPEQNQLDKFFEIFIHNISMDDELRKLYVDEYYKEAIFEIKKNIIQINENVDQIVKNTQVTPLLIKDAYSYKVLEHSFNYRQRTSNFVGRGEEISKLMEFFFSDSNFSWWAITGRGGVGKSRLALELCLELEKLNINCGFLPIQQINSLDWNNWRPEIPHLFIIDLAASNYQNILNLINHLVNRIDLNSPVKILIIDRDSNGEWWRKIFKKL